MTAPTKPLSQPCRECPWKKSSAPGWLGAATPVEFLQQSESGIHMPCHLTVNYDAPNWEAKAAKAAKAPACQGRLVHFANRCKRVPGLPKVDADREHVFSNPQEFIDHHSMGQGPKVLIVGAQVIPTS